MPRLARIAVVCLAGLGLAGCGESRTEADEGIRIGMMPKLMGISFFDVVRDGATQAAGELGVKLTFDGPTVDSSEEQAEMIDAWVAQGFDVIAVAPNDPDAIVPTLVHAKKLGVTVMTWDTDANPKASGRSLFVNQAEAESIADALVDVMVEGAGEDGQLKGKFLIVSAIPTAANQNSWMGFMIPRLKREHPECELLETLYPGEDERNSRVQSANALAAHSDLKGIWAITSVALPAAAKAARDAGRHEDVYITGLSLPSQMREFVKDGTVKRFVLFDVEDLGYLTIQVAKRLHEGLLDPGTYDLGRLKNIRVTENEAILGEPLIFDVNNIDDYKF